MGLFDGFSGKIGNLVVYRMNGRTVVRTMPAKRKQKPTKGEQRNRNAFRFVMKVMQNAKSVVKIGFAQVAQNRTAFQEAMSVNLHSYKLDNHAQTIGMWLKISNGTRLGFNNLTVKRVGNGSVKLKWSNELVDDNTFLNDGVIALIIDNESLETWQSVAECRRHQGECVVTIPQTNQPRMLSVFAYAIHSIPTNRKNPSHISASQWAGDLKSLTE